MCAPIHLQISTIKTNKNYIPISNYKENKVHTPLKVYTMLSTLLNVCEINSNLNRTKSNFKPFNPNQPDLSEYAMIIDNIHMGITGSIMLYVYN